MVKLWGYHSNNIDETMSVDSFVYSVQSSIPAVLRNHNVIAVAYNASVCIALILATLFAAY